MELGQIGEVHKSYMHTVRTKAVAAVQYIKCNKGSHPDFNESVALVTIKVRNQLHQYCQYYPTISPLLLMKAKEMDQIFKAVNELYSCTGFTGFWNLLDCAIVKDEAAMSKFQSNKKVPKHPLAFGRYSIPCRHNNNQHGWEDRCLDFEMQ